MGFLRLLEGLRTPFFDGLMAMVTYCGNEVVFMVVALILFWCVSKRQGYYLLLTGFYATVLVQVAKPIFRIPRPWVLDPGFTIVEAARADAGGFSFPSGHSQNIAGTLGALFLIRKEKWLRAACAVVIVLVCFSRMYLGVHTPLDVLVGAGIGLLAAIVLYPFCRDDTAFAKSFGTLLTVGIGLSLAYLLFMELYPFPADVDAENLQHGIDSAYTLLGCVLAVPAFRALDRKHPFSVEAPPVGQILKVVLGLGLLLGIRAGLKALFAAVGFTAPLADLIRYFCIIFTGGGLWPLTFPFFAKLGKKEDTHEN